MGGSARRSPVRKSSTLLYFSWTLVRANSCMPRAWSTRKFQPNVRLGKRGRTALLVRPGADGREHWPIATEFECVAAIRTSERNSRRNPCVENDTGVKHHRRIHRAPGVGLETHARPATCAAGRHRTVVLAAATATRRQLGIRIRPESRCQQRNAEEREQQDGRSPPHSAILAYSTRVPLDRAGSREQLVLLHIFQPLVGSRGELIHDFRMLAAKVGMLTGIAAQVR